MARLFHKTTWTAQGFRTSTRVTVQQFWNVYHQKMYIEGQHSSFARPSEGKTSATVERFRTSTTKTCDGTSGLKVYQQHRPTLQQFRTSVKKQNVRQHKDFARPAQKNVRRHSSLHVYQLMALQYMRFAGLSIRKTQKPNQLTKLYAMNPRIFFVD